MGHHVSFAFKLKEGLNKVSSEPFDLVFLDVHLPNHIRTRIARTSVDQKHIEKPDQKGSLRISKSFPNFREVMEKTEGEYFRDLISFTKGDINKVCQISQLSLAQVYRILKKHHITRHL